MGRALQDLPPANGAPFFKINSDDKGECTEIASMDDQCNPAAIKDHMKRVEKFTEGNCPDDYTRTDGVETEYIEIKECSTIAFRVLKKSEPACTGKEDTDPCGAQGSCDAKSGTCFCNK